LLEPTPPAVHAGASNSAAGKIEPSLVEGFFLSAPITLRARAPRVAQGLVNQRNRLLALDRHILLRTLRRRSSIGRASAW
jgi:hypothetical protein